ncbi:hypothetical protein FACS189427_06690 [Planctomycetales bacterium]|nr:hypothetical protein FACS189427_06690 [Planctomycetales bacterium]
MKGNALVKGNEGWQVGCVRFAAVVDGQTHYISSPPLLGTFDWKEVAVEWTVPENTYKLTAEAGNNGASGTIWVDDVRIER